MIWSTRWLCRLRGGDHLTNLGIYALEACRTMTLRKATWSWDIAIHRERWELTQNKIQDPGHFSVPIDSRLNIYLPIAAFCAFLYRTNMMSSQGNEKNTAFNGGGIWQVILSFSGTSRCRAFPSSYIETCLSDCNRRLCGPPCLTMSFRSLTILLFLITMDRNDKTLFT